ncbi:MAG: hypothetical protein U1F41_13580 [Burkholderiales bacterium]
MSRRLLILVASIALVACNRSSNEEFDLVRSFTIDWQDPQVLALTWAMETCAIWGTQPTIARACLERQDEARHLLDGVVTCQRSENIGYAACARVDRWARGKSQDLFQIVKLSGSPGRDEDLASLRGLVRPSNPFIGVLWTSDDRWLALRLGAWKELAATLLGLTVVAVSIRRLRSRAQRSTATLTKAHVPIPVPVPAPVAEATASESICVETAPSPLPEDENVGIESVVENIEVEPEMAAEEAAAIARKEARVVARRAAADAAQREFDQVKGLF